MKKIKLMAAACLLIMSVKAQNYDITGVKRIHPLSLRSLIEQDEVKGYYAFYQLDKASKKEALYNLSILDNNLKQTYSVELKKSDKLALLESSYNGAGFCLSFVDMREKVLEYQMLDKTGKTVGSYTLEISKNEAQAYQGALAAEESFYAGGMLAIKNKGFLRMGYEKKSGMRVELEMIDNTGKLKWSINSGVGEDEKSYESAEGLYADDKTIVTAFTTRGKKMSTKGMENFLKFVDVDSGKELFNYKQNDGQYLVQNFGVSYDQNSNSFFVYGQYFGKEDNILKDDSKGMFIQEVGRDGKLKSESYTPWAPEINGLIVKKLKGDLEKNMKTFIHKVVRTADGKVFAITEHYRKAVNGGAMAARAGLAVLGGLTGVNTSSNVSAVKVELYNMVVFEFDNALKIKDVHIVEKEKTNVSLVQGMGTIDANKLGFFLQMWGDFDYAFTTVTPDRTQFNSAYVNYDKDKEAGSKYTVGNITYKDNNVKVDRIKLTGKPTFFRVLPTKPGYIAIYEYFKKEKKAVLRLEKLNN